MATRGSTSGRTPADTSPPSAKPAQPARARRGKAETTTAILDAAERLFAERNPQSVTVRDVAAEAGVTHALVHQYVGSKEDLLNAVIQRAAPDRQAVIRTSASFRETLSQLVPGVLDQRLHSRTMVRSAMDGIPYLSLQERIETGQMLIDLAQRCVDAGDERSAECAVIDARVDVAALIALTFGWVALEDWLMPICGLDEEDPAHVRAELLRLCECLGELVFPAPEAGTVD